MVEAQPVVAVQTVGGRQYAAPAAEGLSVNVANTVNLADLGKRAAPVKGMWICLAIAWLFFIMPIPLTVFVAGPMNLAVIILAILCLVREAALHGALGLVGSTIGSTIIYLIGLALTAAVMGSSMAGR